MAKLAKDTYTPEQLMLMAIEESRNSIPEHDDRTDPLVGAIIATEEGEILAKAHRGELRVGEHCEYTLIERKLKDKNLRDCVLYVTLEPCTDNSRKSPKRGCSTHVVKARLKRIYVGIEDPNPKIATQGIKFLEDSGIEVHMFPDHLEQLIRYDNEQFIKEKEAEALQAKQAPMAPPKDLLEQPAVGTTIHSFSTNAIQQFIGISGSPLTYPSGEFNRWAEEFKLIEREDNNIVPTGLGLMLFGSHPENSYPQTVFKVEIDYGGEKTEIRDFKGPLVEQLPAILEFVKDKALKLTINRAQGVRTEQTDFPFSVLREAIANAIIHRNYTIEGATNYLYIGLDKIILRSPGEPMRPLTIDDLRTFDTPSLSRNPKIMYVFNQMKLAEQRGIGLRNMKTLPQQGFPQPVFRSNHGMLEVIFARSKNAIIVNPDIDNELTEEDKEGIIFLQGRDQVTAGEYAAFLGISAKTAQRHLARLVELGEVEIMGVGRWTKYKLRRN
jgi:ATP-dependent DNA helicase RecG